MGLDRLPLAVVLRPADKIRVVDKYDPTRTRTFSRGDRLFYEPFRKDAGGRPLDQVIDWAALPREDIKSQKAQAILITLAANSVIANRRSPEYWEVERRWLDGEYKEITAERLTAVRARMQI